MLAARARSVKRAGAPPGLPPGLEQADDAEAQRRERVTRDQAAADQRHGAHVLRQALVAGVLRSVRLCGVEQRRERAAEAEPERGSELDEAAERRCVRAGQE